MEGQLVRRRMNTLAGHFASADDKSATATHLFPMNCSGGLNTVIQRRDNRMFFARQGSGSQACFMRPVSTEQPQNCSGSLNSFFQRYDNRMYFARQGSSSQACFMRPVSTEQGSSAPCSVPLECTRSVKEGSCAFEEPVFSRPARLEANFLNVGVIHPLVQDHDLPASEQPPKFSRPNRGTSGQNQEQYPSMKKIHASESHGFEWSPRMDVAESGCSYIVTVELPGVSINDIRVEVNDKTLTVMGKRSTQWWKVKSFSNDSISAYHKREILQGPYQVAWSLPTNVNKDGVSAEILDGFLRVTIPKL